MCCTMTPRTTSTVTRTECIDQICFASQQVLRSIYLHPTPTRAEATNVENAFFVGAMLCSSPTRRASPTAAISQQQLHAHGLRLRTSSALAPEPCTTRRVWRCRQWHPWRLSGQCCWRTTNTLPNSDFKRWNSAPTCAIKCPRKPDLPMCHDAYYTQRAGVPIHLNFCENTQRKTILAQLGEQAREEAHRLHSHFQYQSGELSVLCLKRYRDVACHPVCAVPCPTDYRRAACLMHNSRFQIS